MSSERCILHADLNNFYASVECLYRPELRNVPMVVGGDVEMRHGIVLAKNDPAKICGVATAEPLWEARKKCANLVVIPPHPDKYLRFSRSMRNIYLDYTDRVEPFGMDEAWLDVTGGKKSGEEIAREIRDRAREELGLTASVGVANNKVFAKLGSDMKKPDATTVITSGNYKEKVWPLPAQDLIYVGASTRQKLYSRNILTIGDIARASRKTLTDMLGKSGDVLWTFANGYDTSPVARATDEAPPKSIGNSTTMPRDVHTPSEAKVTLFLLAECVAERMREAGYRGSVVHLFARGSSLSAVTRQKKLSHPTDISGEIAACAMDLLTHSYDWHESVRTIGVSMSQLSPADGAFQLCFWGDPERDKARALDVTIGDIRRRFGHFSIERGIMLTDRPMSSANPKDAQEAQTFANMHPI